MPRSAWILFAGTFGFGGLIAQIVGGLLADRIGRRNAIALSMFSSGALTLALWQARSLALIVLLMFAIGTMAELHRPAASALIADLLPSEQRVTAFTLFRLAINVGWASGLALGGFLAERSFDLVFVGDAATSIAFGAISLAALPHGTRTKRHEETHLASARASILADRGFLLFLAAVLVTGAVYSQNVSTLPLHIREAGFSPSTYGLLQSLNGVIVVLFELPVISWTQRHDRFRVVAVGDRRRSRAGARARPVPVGVRLDVRAGVDRGTGARDVRVLRQRRPAVGGLRCARGRGRRVLARRRPPPDAGPPGNDRRAGRLDV